MAFPEVGDTLDIFTLCSPVHQGPLADIFLAEDLLSGQQVVLKIPGNDILNHPLLLYHYQNEDRISRRLNHPGIIRFFHRQRSRQYIIMEYLPGPDLRSKVGRGRPLELPKALALMEQLCNIIVYLHGQSIVHLDIKPENIICCQNNGIKLIDFGLASCRKLPDLLALDMQNPQGTPWYIAPEQLLGERADPRCDIYSMGMLLYEMLTGELPWPRSNKIRIARKRLRQDPTPPRYFNKNVPAQIQSVILRAIARHAEDRYASALDFRYDLKHWARLPITQADHCCKKKTFWHGLFSGKIVKRSRKQLEAPVLYSRPQIIGALIDSPESEYMVAEIRKQALIHNADVTLVHVIEEEDDSHVRRYGITVEGEKLMNRFEEAVQLLRRYSIDPSIRLVRGKVTHVLTELSMTMGARFLILGISRKKEGSMFGLKSSVLSNLKKISRCPLIIADRQPFSPLTDLAVLQPEQLTAEQVLSCDLFLVDLWYEYLHYYSDVIYYRLLNPKTTRALKYNNCLLSHFLEILKLSEHWYQVTSSLAPICQQSHSVAKHITGLCISDHAGMLQLYTDELLPLACKLKDELSLISLTLRSHLEKQPPTIPFFSDQNCQLTKMDMVSYGPLLKIINLNQDLKELAQQKHTHGKNEQPRSTSPCG